MLKKSLKYAYKTFLNWFRQESLYHRLFWGIVISVSTWNILSIFFLTINRFFADSISIGIETTYLRWNNTFPAISFCLTKNRSSTRISEFVTQENITYTVSRSNYIKNVHDYMFTNPNNMHIKEENCAGLNATCNVDILRVRRELLPHNCEVFMGKISFLGTVYENCSDIFNFHQTEMGYCFLANNILDYPSFDNLPLKFDISHKDLSMKINLKGGFFFKYEMYVHSPEDLPYFNSITYDSFSDPTIYRFNVEEYVNNPDVRKEAVHKRLCKFPDEKEADSPWHYSFSTCMSNLRIKYELEQCNCTHFTSHEKFKSQYCDLKGLRCISDSKISTQIKEYVASKNVCLPSCLEQQITLVGSNEVKNFELSETFYAEISITNLPSVRYSRVVTQTFLDLVVSVGGIIGLFAGASVLNIFEIFYVLLRTKY